MDKLDEKKQLNKFGKYTKEVIKNMSKEERDKASLEIAKSIVLHLDKVKQILSNIAKEESNA